MYEFGGTCGVHSTAQQQKQGETAPPLPAGLDWIGSFNRPACSQFCPSGFVVMLCHTVFQIRESPLRSPVLSALLSQEKDSPVPSR